MHSVSQLFPYLGGVGAFVVALRPADDIGRQFLSSDMGSVPLQKHISFYSLIDYVMYPLIVVYYADKIHYLRYSHNIVHIKNFGDVSGLEHGSGAFQPRHGRNTGRCEYQMPERCLSSVFQHKFDSVHPHYVAYFVRVCAYRRRSPANNRASEVFRYHH